MLEMSFYKGTLDRVKAREVVEASEKPLMFRYGFAFRGAEKRPITKEKALSIIDDSGNYLDITDVVVISLTDREQTLLSDSVLTMIENAGQAQRLVCDTESQKAIDIHIKELQALNRKLCTTGIR